MLIPFLCACFSDTGAKAINFSPEIEIIEPSAPIQVLEGDDVVSSYRELMGATNPAEADEGTLRKSFATSLGENAVHGSDSLKSAEREIAIMNDLF